CVCCVCEMAQRADCVCVNACVCLSVCLSVCVCAHASVRVACFAIFYILQQLSNVLARFGVSGCVRARVCACVFLQYIIYFSRYVMYWHDLECLCVCVCF